MPFDIEFDLEVGGQAISDVTFTWGMRGSYADARRGVPGWGTQIETAAVIQLLSLIDSGAVTAKEVRELLCQAAAEIEEEAQRPEEQALLPAQRTEPKVESVDLRQVYAVSSVASPNIVKIGVTGDLRKRLKGLQTGSGSPLVVRWTSAGGGRLESELHSVFSNRSVGGEWFDFTDVDDPVQTIKKAAEKIFQRLERGRGR